MKKIVSALASVEGIIVLFLVSLILILAAERFVHPSVDLYEQPGTLASRTFLAVVWIH
ncbi:hypothetical protein [Ruegeria sp. HKCCA6837]|uniref:hypothetical protein n=1 Tax=Ruegeria sp. HKCCA6837 TaxID=2682989 RepID=UPI00148984E6|nr:hypothetical protein [Ruegeria sp. HKCCA6837]